MQRIESPGDARYITFSCYHRLPLFGNDKIRDAFADRLAMVHRIMGFKLHAWVVMPEHVHLLVVPHPPDLTVEKMSHRLKSRFAQDVIARWRELNAPILRRLIAPDGKYRFWQDGGGYDRNLNTAHVIREAITYIHRNPVVRGLVDREIDWKWSSARWYADMDDRGPTIDAGDW